MVDGRPHEFVSDACERDLEQNLGENISKVVLTFNVQVWRTSMCFILVFLKARVLHEGFRNSAIHVDNHGFREIFKMHFVIDV